MSGGEDDILFEQRGVLGLITLNKPQALNAVSLKMIEALSAKLSDWSLADDIAAVAIRGAGECAFSAGGDIRELYQRRGSDFGRIYYAYEYKLDIVIHRYPKPYLALMDGVTMGGGAGISVHGSHRIVSERTTFAMPETGIGLFPDVGASWFLNRCPGEVGMYLALTGYRMGAADTLYAGIGDIFIPSDAQELLIDDLERAGRLDRAAIDEILHGHGADAGTPPLKAHRAEIDRCFGAASVEEVLTALDGEGSEWAQKQLQVIAVMSPTSLKVALRQLRAGRGLERIEDVMAMEYRLAAHFYDGHDFFEGTRALIIDKDGAPDWRPASLTEVSEAAIDDYFRALPGEPCFDRSVHNN